MGTRTRSVLLYVVSVEGLIITETNTQTESISEMILKFWILQEHLRDIRDDPEVLDPPKYISASMH